MDDLVLITAFGVGGATCIGAVIGFFFKHITHKFSDIVLSFAAGVMLSAAVFGLIIPSLEYGGKYGIIITVLGIFAGALMLSLIDKLVPHLHKMAESADEEAHKKTNIDKDSEVLDGKNKMNGNYIEGVDGIKGNSKYKCKKLRNIDMNVKDEEKKITAPSASTTVEKSSNNIKNIFGDLINMKEEEM